ncbi:hypothetical protein CROQUDRAFT_659833 [Cronartium quercuum f. sp. fusiforme G11]|uniref:Uncharacterized protein n=1 Tax=Cronartium quercuum f. sp. fusiforme G11 TaxID=708437 RepID=A0A9P6TAD9_9BASI|nr:hypothetical protein CROQUDRAFT_659833 [Cronartium quercuum f. sp. fusiforme G11]
MSSLNIVEGSPICVSVREHAQITQTTPTSFDSLPPICRLELEPVKINGYSAWENVSLKLFITERELGFYSAERSKSLIISYPNISLHAISRTESGTQPCIYCQLDEYPVPGQEEQEEETERDTIELRIIPEDPTRLEEIFEVLSACAALHPSIIPTDEDDDRDGFFGESIATLDESQELSEAGRQTLGRLEGLLDEWIPPNHTTTPSTLTNGNHHSSPSTTPSHEL